MSLLKVKIPDKFRSIVLWLARIWASLTLAFVLWFLLAHIYSAVFLNEQQGTGLSTIQDILLFTCFPIGTCFGLAIAYKWELTGGLVATTSLLLMFAIQISFDSIRQEITLTDLTGFLREAGIFLTFIMPPGLLYLIYGILERKQIQNYS